jgi:putative transposase
MRNLAVLFIHLIAILARLLGPGGVRSIVAESLLLKHQLLIVNRSRQRAPNLSAWDRILAGWMALLVRPTRLLRSAIVLKPSTLVGFHKAMSQRKYRMLFSPNRPRNPGPHGPSAELIRAVVEMKQRNPNWGCPRIAQQIGLAFLVPIDKDAVRRILAHHYRPGRPSGGPSWLTFLGHMKDSLWSIDLFRCESATLRTYWVMVVMDQYTRRIIGFGVQAGTVDGVALCRMCNRAIRGHRWLPNYDSFSCGQVPAAYRTLFHSVLFKKTVKVTIACLAVVEFLGKRRKGNCSAWWFQDGRLAAVVCEPSFSGTHSNAHPLGETHRIVQYDLMNSKSIHEGDEL